MNAAMRTTIPAARVLYLTTSGQVGGAERCLLSLIAGLDRDRFDPAVLIGSPGPLRALLDGDGIAAAELPLPGALRRLSRSHPNRGLNARLAPWWQTPAYLARLCRAGQRRHPRLIHSNGPKMHVLSALLQRRWGVPLIWHLHDFPADRRSGAEPNAEPNAEPWFNRGLERLSGRVHTAIANSAAVAAAYAERLPRLAPKLRVIPNGVDPAALRGGDRGGFRQRLGLGPEDFVAGMVAIFAPWKGQEVFLEAASMVRKRLPTARFVLAGDDIYDTAGHGKRRQELQARAQALGLAQAVIFTGYLSTGAELAAAYAALDVMVHASTRPEPFGRTLIEAMAAGTPVIAANAGGVPEIVSDGGTGVLTPPGDATALAEAMVRLHDDIPLRRRLAEAGARRVETTFSQAVVNRSITALYEDLLTSPS